MGKLKIPGINSDWRRALVLDPQYQMGIEFEDKKGLGGSLQKDNLLGLPNSPTSYIEKAIPADSAFHPHSSLLVEEEKERKKRIRDEERERDYERVRKQIASSAYKPKAMNRGGRVKPVDGCAVKGKTKPPVF